MQNQTSFKVNSSDINSTNLGLSLPTKNHAPSQNFFSNEHFHYNPYFYYHHYWSFPYDFHFSHQYFNLHQNHRNQDYMNQQNKTDLLQSHHFQQPITLKTQNSTVKIEPLEVVKDKQTVQQLRNPKRQYKMHKKLRKNNACYYWSSDENRRYSDFLNINAHLFSMSLSQKKNLRVNVMMSKKVKTRTPQQCHSHHQKMIKKYGTIDSIVKAMKRESQQFQGRNCQGVEPIYLQDQVVKDHIKKEAKIDF